MYLTCHPLSSPFILNERKAYSHLCLAMYYHTNVLQSNVNKTHWNAIKMKCHINALYALLHVDVIDGKNACFIIWFQLLFYTNYSLDLKLQKVLYKVMLLHTCAIKNNLKIYFFLFSSNILDFLIFKYSETHLNYKILRI